MFHGKQIKGNGLRNHFSWNIQIKKFQGNSVKWFTTGTRGRFHSSDQVILRIPNLQGIKTVQNAWVRADSGVSHSGRLSWASQVTCLSCSFYSSLSNTVNSAFITAAGTFLSVLLCLCLSSPFRPAEPCRVSWWEQKAPCPGGPSHPSGATWEL